MLALILVVLCVAPSNALYCGSDNCYELLGLKRSATKSDVRRAYRKLSVEKHPDKRPGDQAAVEEFSRIGNAYAALKDDAKRAKYDDFLDNPGKYMDYIARHSKPVYAPKTNVIIAFALIIGAATLINWLNMNNSYKNTLERMRESQEFKREVSRLVKTKAAANREEAEGMINLDVVGLEPPHWKNLAIVQLVNLPGKVWKVVFWNLSWVWRYKIRKLEYTVEDKEFLIRQNLSMSELEYERLGEAAQGDLIKDELWIKEKADEYLRLERISLNRAGKAKKHRAKTNTKLAVTEASD